MKIQASKNKTIKWNTAQPHEEKQGSTVVKTMHTVQ